MSFRSLLISLAILSAGCNKQMNQFVDGAVRGPTGVTPPTPVIHNNGGANTIKVSPGRVRNAGAVNSMEASVTANTSAASQIHGATHSMTIGISKTPVIQQ